MPIIKTGWILKVSPCFLLTLSQVLGWDSYESRPITMFGIFFVLCSIFILGYEKHTIFSFEKKNVAQVKDEFG